MGKSWKKSGMMDVAAKKGKIFTKLAKEIFVATKLGGPDPEGNPRLKMSIRAALDVSCPKATIERAIKKGSGQGGESENIEEVTYEGQGPYNVGVIVECQTDNRNRTVSNIRSIFNKKGGKMGDNGSASWMFDRVCLVEAEIKTEIDPEEEAIEVNANDVEKNEDSGYSFYGEPEDLDTIRTSLVSRGWDVTKAELSYKSKNITELDEEKKSQVILFLEALDDDEDTHKIHATVE